MYPNEKKVSGTSSKPLQSNLLNKTHFCKIHFNTTYPSMKTRLNQVFNLAKVIQVLQQISNT